MVSHSTVDKGERWVLVSEEGVGKHKPTPSCSGHPGRIPRLVCPWYALPTLPNPCHQLCSASLSQCPWVTPTAPHLPGTMGCQAPG